MNPARFSLNRSVTTYMAALAVVLLGLLGLSNLKIDLLPDITFPILTVMTRYPGAGPQEVEEFVTKPIEEAAAIVEDLKSIRSISQDGLSVVILEFEWGTDMDDAAFDTREKVDPVINWLPGDAHRPLIGKMDPSTMMPVMEMEVTGMEDMERLRKITEDVIKPELEKLEGVAAATIYGGLQREILVQVDRARLDAYGLSVGQIENILRSENLNLPAGYTTEGTKEYTIRTIGQFQSVDEIADIAIAAHNGTPIRLRDVAQVKDSHKEIRSFARLNGEPCVALEIAKESVANTVEVSNAVHQAVGTLPERLPAGVELQATFDQAEYIKQSLNNLYEVALEGGILAVIVIFFFLAAIRNTIVIAVSIPMSLIATFVLMYYADMTLNIITMGGLVLAIGRMVDDSIVVLENIYRHITEQGETVTKAALSGTGEVASACLATTLATFAVFFPLLLIGGLVGEIFASMAWVVMFGLAASLLVALTLVPLLCSRFMAAAQPLDSSGFPLPPGASPTRPSRYGDGAGRGVRLFGILPRLVEKGLGKFQQGFGWLTQWYLRAITWALSHRAMTTAIAGGTFIISLMLMGLVGLEFFPTMEENQVFINVETPIGSSIQYTDQMTQELERIMQQTPEFQLVGATGGELGAEAMMMGMGGGGTNTASLFGKLTPRSQRERHAGEIEAELREKFDRVPGVTARFTEMGPGAMGGADIEVVISGDELPVLSRLGNEVMDGIADVPGLHDLDLNWRPGKPEYQVFIDRQKAGALGITAGQVAATLQTLVRGTQQLTKYREAGEEYDIKVRAAEADRDWIETVKDATIVSPYSGQVIPLTEIADIRPAAGPSQIHRDERQRVVRVTAGKSPDRALTDILKDVAARIKPISHNWPSSYSYEFAGAEEDRREAFAGMFVALIMGILLIYMILASQFESLVHPLTIMLAIPLEIIGVSILLLLTGTVISLMVFLGILLLTGIVVSNSILLVQMINLLRQRGMPTREAIIEGGRIRLRPILMTAFTTGFAMIPMALAMREGSEMWQPLALTAVGGLISSTFLTLLVVPVAYSVFEEVAVRLGLSKSNQVAE